MQDGMRNKHKSDWTYVNDMYGNARLGSGCCAIFDCISLTALLLRRLLLQGIARHRQSVSSQQNNLNLQITVAITTAVSDNSLHLFLQGSMTS